MKRGLSSGRSRRRVELVALMACGVALVVSGVRGQERAPDAGGVEVDPIKCWWRTDKAAVEVGERFTLTLTCGVVETESVKAVPDPNQLDPGALEITPFEVVGGTRHEDLQAPPWRYFQYEYSVRLLDKGFFGRDVDIPSINLRYSIASTGGPAEGREQVYVLPALPIRIVSLVPAKAADIRDVSGETFGDIEARSRRSAQALVAAAVSFGFALVLLGLAVGRTIRGYRQRTPAATHHLPAATLLGGCLSALRALRSEVAADGWTPDRATRALAVFRVAAAVALGRTVAQSEAARDAPVREGQVPMRRGVVRPKRTLVSAAVSPDLVGRQLAAMESAEQPDARASTRLEDIRAALQTFSVTRYGRSDQLDGPALDAVLDRGEAAIRGLRRTHVWPFRWAGSASKFASGAGATVWSR